MRNSALAAVAFVVAMSLAACGGGGGTYGSSSPTSPTTSGGGSGGGANIVTITIKGVNGKLSFNPNPASVPAGQVVQYKNADVVAHQIVLDDGSARTEVIQPGATSASLSVGGSNSAYHCSIHPSMVGSFNSAVTPDPPPCTGYCG
jgi:plastocyanin